MNKVSIAVVISGLTLLGAAYSWDLDRESKVHDGIRLDMVMGDVELDLQRVNLELKMLRTIKERRPLTNDEQDREDYLKKLRMMLIERQSQHVQKG